MGKQQSQSSQAWQETPYFQEPRVMWDKLNDATQQVSQRNTARAMTRPTRLKISQCLPSLYILLHLMCHNYSSLCTRSCVWGAAPAMPRRHWSTVGAGRQSTGAASKREESLRRDTAQKGLWEAEVKSASLARSQKFGESRRFQWVNFSPSSAYKWHSFESVKHLFKARSNWRRFPFDKVMASNSRVLKTRPKLRAESLQNLPATASHSCRSLLLHEALMALNVAEGWQLHFRSQN